jgi:PAS domain S-box-containing protein
MESNLMNAYGIPDQPPELGFQNSRNTYDSNRQSFLPPTEGQEMRELQKFIEIYDGATEGNALMDREGHIIYINQAACSWIGYTQEDLLRLHLSDVNPDYDEVAYQQLFDQASQKALAPFETVLTSKDGITFPIEISLRGVHFDGKPLMLAIARDLTLRKQMEEQQRRYLRYASLRADISQALTQQSSLPFMLQLCCEAMVSHLDVSSARLWTLNDKEHVLELQASAGSTSYHLDTQRRIPVETSKINYLVREQQPYLINDVLTDPRINDKAWAMQEGIVAIAGYPLILDQQVVGIMALFAQKRFTEETFDLLTLIADAIAQGIGRKRAEERLEQQVEQRTRELSLLLHVSHTLASTLQREPLMNTILAELKTVVEYNGAFLYALQEDQSILLAYQSVLPAHIMAPLTQLFRLQPYLWQLLQQRKVTIIDDVGAVEAFTRKIEREMGAYSREIFALYHSWMAVPLVANEHPIGILTMNHHTPHFYKQHHADLVFALANQAAVALENMFLYEQAQALAALQERQRLARELHDSVSQDFYGVGLNAQIAYEALETDPEEARSALEQIIELAEAGQAETRALLLELRPEVLAAEGLIAALEKQGTILRKRYKLQVEASLNLQAKLSFEKELAIYRIAQEALNNVVKHAQAETVTLRLAQEGQELVLEVRDNGKGFDVTNALPGGVGLQSMQDRVAHLQGTLTINSAPGQGTSLSVRVPITSKET